MVKNSASSARPSKKSKKKKVSLTHGGKAPSGVAHGGEAPSAHGGKALEDPWAGDLVAVEWRLNDGSHAFYKGSVVFTTGTHLQVTYDEDGSTHVHPVSGTRWRHDFSTEKGCLKEVTGWAKGNRVPVRKDNLARMGATYQRLARCRSKEQMFKGWREVATDFWAAFSSSVANPSDDA